MNISDEDAAYTEDLDRLLGRRGLLEREPAVTLDERLQGTEGRPSGFDYLRIILSIGVLCWHSVVTSYGPAFQDQVQASAWRPLVSFILPCFFALSGFLVAGSLDRSKTIVGFLGLRVIRIYPALSVEVLISAFILGPLLTRVPLDQYFTDPSFYRYIANVSGHISYALPGVFLDNPKPITVNGQLWTVPWELACYISIGILAALGFARRPRLFCVAVLIIWVCSAALFFARLNPDRAPSGLPAYLLVISFLCGIAVYLNRDKLPWSRSWCVVAILLSAGFTSMPLIGDVFVPLPMAYATVYLGLCNPRKLSILRGADYSYGVFLYGYAFQQSFMSIGPAVQHWYINILLALPTTIVAAALSWHFVEKPALRLRVLVKRFEDYTGVKERLTPLDLVLKRLRPPRRVETP